MALKPLAVNFGRAALPTILATEHPSTPTHLDTLILRRMTAQLGPALAQEKFAEYHAASAARGSDFNLDGLFHQPAGTVYEAPFGFSITHFGLYHAADVDEGYFFENLNLVTPDEVHRKVGELAAHSGRPLLLLDGRENACKTTAVQSRAAITRLFLYPYRAGNVHQDDVGWPLCQFIQEHYHMAQPPTSEHFGYALWQPNP